MSAIQTLLMNKLHLSIHSRPSNSRKSWISKSLKFVGIVPLLAVLGWQSEVNAQSDNFDSGTLSSDWTKFQFFGQSYTFPTVGTGKGLRIQAAPVPGTAPAAAAIAQTNEYTDFYVAVDVVNWAVKNQAIVLFARWTPNGAAGLAEGTGYILNYDVAQDGDQPGDRKGGQLQINLVSPGFAASTVAAAEITFEPGQSYRLVFQGVGNLLKGQAYDLNDLTKPLVTFYFVDDFNTYPSGLSGFLSFSRDGTTGTTDVTIDNYLATVSDPNTASAPAIAHPIPGTPVVTARVPSDRWANFHNPATGISFTANTFTASQINASATKLYLNGVDSSAALAPLPANGSTASFSTAAGTLQANTTYSARIELEDTTGTLKSTNTFWFDTFSDAYLATLKTVEAEDYNYSNGVYQLDPIAVSGLDTNGAVVNGNAALGGNDKGYYGFAGTAGVDYSKPGGAYWLELAEYRPDDRVQITQGSTTTLARDEAGDITDLSSNLPPMRIQSTQRSKYVVTNVWEYQVRLTSPGDWMNYTRNFTPTNYNVYLRCSSFGSTTVYLDQVTSDPTVANQSVVRFGAFNVGNNLMRLNYKYVQLMAGSSPAVVSLSGLETIRLTLGGTAIKDDRLVNLDYLVFIPTSDNPTIIYPVFPPTVLDTFDDGNDTSPAWTHYDPLGGLGDPFPTASFITTGGVYHLIAPAPPVGDAGPARAGSFLTGREYTDFYVSADLIDFDDTVRQAFGIAARIRNPGLGTTDGYLFSWEPGGGTLPGTNNGDLDISRLIGETPVGQIETEPSGLHLERGKSYRFVFMGSGTNFEGRVYEYPDLSNPIKTLPANDPDNLYPSGMVGLIVASQGDIAVSGNATFDNFLVTTAEPKLEVSQSGGNVSLSWPFIPYRLLTSPSIGSPVWTEVTTGITYSNGKYGYTVPATSQQYFRLVYP